MHPVGNVAPVLDIVPNDPFTRTDKINIVVIIKEKKIRKPGLIRQDHRTGHASSKAIPALIIVKPNKKILPFAMIKLANLIVSVIYGQHGFINLW